MRLRFILYVAWRTFRARRRSSGIASSLLSVLGVGVGVMVLTSVLGVMNGFQLGFIESILEVSSYHLQISRPDGRPLPPEALQAVARVPGVMALVGWSESQAIAEGSFGRQRGCLVRGLPEDVRERDAGFRQAVRMAEGSFDLAGRNSIVLGVELARLLGVSVGEPITLLTLSGQAYSRLIPVRREFWVSGLFRTGYYEFDSSLALISLPAAGATFWGGQEPPLTYGIKLADRFRDRQTAAAVRVVLGVGPGAVPAGAPKRSAFAGATGGQPSAELRETRSVSGRLAVPDARVASWREYNRAFFGALLMEKIVMVVLIGLIFVVVGFNIYHTLRRAVRERYEEISLLKALGSPTASVRFIFILDGFLIGLLGGLFGLATGLLITGNINQVFGLVESAVNFTAWLVQGLLFPLSGGAGEGFSIFSPTYFYLLEVPSRVLFPEALLIVLFGLFSSTTAAFLASMRVAEIRPVEILRYE